MSEIDARDLYRRFSTERLTIMREAFEADKVRESDDPESVAFCDGRIAIIDEILKERSA